MTEIILIITGIVIGAMNAIAGGGLLIGFPVAAVGSYLLSHTPASHFSALVPWLILLAVALFAVQPYIHNRLHRHIHSKTKGTRPLIFIGLALLVMSVYGGYFGPGFGFILLAFLGFTKLNHVHQMNGLKNIAAVCMGLTSIIVLANGPFIDWSAGLLMGAGSIFGGYVGAKVAQKTSGQWVRAIVIVTGVVTATILVVRNYS
jgi:uncharacterized membrane protein YfcA